jgi:hypothetical protein
MLLGWGFRVNSDWPKLRGGGKEGGGSLPLVLMGYPSAVVRH